MISKVKRWKSFRLKTSIIPRCLTNDVSLQVWLRLFQRKELKIMVKLQDEILAKEGAQARALRRRCDKRTVCFMNAKKRTIGIDRNELDRQIVEKEQLRQAERETNQHEAEYQSQLCRYLEESEMASREARARDEDDVKETLQEQMRLPKNNALSKGDPLDPDTCGLSSVQKLAGEDAQKATRTRMQQEQIRQWCSDSIREKRQMAEEESNEENCYSQYILAEDNMRVNLAEADEVKRLETYRSVQAENLELARLAQLRKQQERERDRELSEAEVSRSKESHLLTEDTDFAKSTSSPHRYRPDHFKGFGKNELIGIYNENAKIIEEKKATEANQAQAENDWATYQNDVVRHLEQVEIDQQRYITEQHRLRTRELQEQRRELKEKQERMRKESFGAVGEGFFNRFGTSCR